MAKSAAGKWVSRVGSSGGGKSYQKSRPFNYYGALVVIVILGLASVMFTRYEYQHPNKAKAGTPPTVGTTWYAALNIDVCGQSLGYLAADPKTSGGFTLMPKNVIKISPVSAADSGNNATLSQFAAEYPGLIASSTQLTIPVTKGKATTSVAYHNGEACASGTKYAGQSGTISFAYWVNFGQKKPTITTNPSSIRFTQFMRVTMAFLPSGVTPSAPRQATVNAMVQANASTTSTTTPVTSPTTTVAPTASSTTVPATPTTTPSTTTTAPKG